MQLEPGYSNFILNSFKHEIYLANKYQNNITNVFFLLDWAKHEKYSANCWHFHLYKQHKFHAQLSGA